MDKAKKKFASAIDGLRSLHNRIDVAVDEKIQPEHCCFEKVEGKDFKSVPSCIKTIEVLLFIAVFAEILMSRFAKM
ncbi:hypothetical protein ANCDUO_01412 [Ancylostoma duodenale]|uniref:Uncharacterized protein n=1 Tax=Ancylostoma duodenale TaxID=51022 RepID=A0A0C2HF90_9BILA|nr:hypothetical protein ANCDUO_01412 [Ancylostoma duodenale]